MSGILNACVKSRGCVDVKRNVANFIWSKP